MDKMKKKRLYTSLIKYLIPCFIICAAGICLIMWLSEYFQRWYLNRAGNIVIATYVYTDDLEISGKVPEWVWKYKVIRYSKAMLIPLWSVVCLWFTFRLFYRRELEEPVDVLSKASERILGDDLDFTVESRSDNELGALCYSFETMRKNLYDSNYQLWKSLEERKRLNSAFSHDLRTPITVLKGYTELAEQFDGQLSPEKQQAMLRKMTGQIERLERYTEKMSGIHKLEDIIPEESCFTFGQLCKEVYETGSLVCADKIYSQNNDGDKSQELFTDRELVMQVCENLVANASRYADSRVNCRIYTDSGKLYITFSDDGEGFSEEALRKAWQPFYRGGDENEKEHFGLGLYICRLLCRKCGGDIALANNENGGGAVTASFDIKKSESR